MGNKSGRSIVVFSVLCTVVLSAVFGPAIVGAAGGDPTIQEANVTGDGVVQTTEGDHASVWINQTYTLRLVVESDSSTYRICTETGTTTNESCRQVPFQNGTSTVDVGWFPWENNETGMRTVNVSIKHSANSDVYDTVERQVDLLDPAADGDSDGLHNWAEVREGTNMSLSDTDNDGLEDGSEVSNYDTDPLSNDSDSDGIPDAVEVEGKTDPLDPDSDDDRLEDGREVNELGTDPTESDSDEDGLSDYREVEELGTDPTDPDSDEDGYSDGREVNELGTDPLDSTEPADSISDYIETILPTTMGESLSVLGSLIVLAAGMAVAVSAVREREFAALFARWRSDDDADGDAAVGSTARPQTTTESVEERTTEGNDTMPEPLLTDTERVLEILRENGGQVKQKQVVAETNWSKSKVSRLLSTMAEDGDIRKITLGRENVIRVPEQADADDEGDDE